MNRFILCLGFFLFVIDISAQCTTCTVHEYDQVTDAFICDLPAVPSTTCSVSIDTCFSGALLSAFVNDPPVDDAVDSQYFTIPPNMVVEEIEWCIIDQALATSGTITIGSYTANYTGMGDIDTICVVHTLATPLSPGTHAFSVTGTLQFINLVEWKIKLKLKSCSSMVNLSLPESGIVDIESSDWIKSSQILGGTAVVDYDALDSIMLLPNFHATLGSIFHAFIDGCGGN